MENELESLIESLQDEPLDYSVNPACQEILKSELKAIEKITELVNIYLKDYPNFTPLAEEFMHPSCLALHRDIYPWFLIQCDDNTVEVWSLLLAAAKEWFPDRNKTKLGHAFCVRFEIEGCTWWNGWEPIQPVVKEYRKWRYNK